MITELLKGTLLDFWVAKAEGHYNHPDADFAYAKQYPIVTAGGEVYSPSGNPAHAYPIIEREKIQTFYHRNAEYQTLPPYWSASIEIEPDEDHLAAGVSKAESKRVFCTGTTVHEAAMRCYVKLRFGAEVEDLA